MTNMKDEAVVMEQNEHFTDRPKIKLIRDSSGKSYDKEVIIDLMDNDEVFIESVKEN